MVIGSPINLQAHQENLKTRNSSCQLELRVGPGRHDSRPDSDSESESPEPAGPGPGAGTARGRWVSLRPPMGLGPGGDPESGGGLAGGSPGPTD